MRRRLLATALFLTAAAAVACGRSGADFLDDGGPTPTGSSSGSPTPTGTGTPVCDPCLPVKGELVVSEVFVRDLTGNASDANLSTASSGGDDRFVEILNVSAKSLDLGGVEVRLANDATNTPFVWHRFAAGQQLPPGDVRVVFNLRDGVDLGPLRAIAGSAATIELANVAGDLGTNGNLGDAGFRVELAGADGQLLFFLVVDRNAGEVILVTRGVESGSSEQDSIPVDPDPCTFAGCSGLYSVALDTPLPWTLASEYVDHRKIRTEDTCDETDADFPCCAFSPGRHATDENGAFRVCTRY